MIKAAALATVGVQRLKYHRHGETFRSDDARLPVQKPGSQRSIVGIAIVVVVLLDNDVTVTMHWTVDRSGDHNVAGPVVTAPLIVEGHLTMMAMVETLPVPVDDHGVVVVPVMAVMSVGLDDDVLCGRDRRCRQGKRQRAKNDCGFHFEFSKKLRRPSLSKPCSTTFVPLQSWRVAPRGVGSIFGGHGARTAPGFRSQCHQKSKAPLSRQSRPQCHVQQATQPQKFVEKARELGDGRVRREL
ncbi:hypothetical protein X741_31130 [Mesorhizobium sp. LNHC229A00]|nr:hypothetical protein X741_31130 [Mesorhizobium sp. LNHC229A00]